MTDFVLCYLIVGSLYVKGWLVCCILKGDVCGGTTPPWRVLGACSLMATIWPYMLVGEVYDNYKGAIEDE